MIAGKRFVIWGLSRLTTRVARALTARQADVVVVRAREGAELLHFLGKEVQVIQVEGDREDELRLAGVDKATCVLALADDDMTNLQASLTAHVIAPNVPVVLRAFDPSLADQFEQGLNVRRAYSVSALAAPAFVAAALGAEVIETMRLGDAEVVLCKLTVRSGSPLVGASTRRIKREYHCGVLALAGADAVWRRLAGDKEELATGDQVVVGGLLRPVLELARQNSGVFEGVRRSPRWRRLRVQGRIHSRTTLLPMVAVALVGLLLSAVLVFGLALGKGPVDALVYTLGTAFGNIATGENDPSWLKVFACVVLIAGGALLGVVFSHLASVATTERLEFRMGRRARRLSGHVVVTGLGNVGYRVQRLLRELKIESAVVELAPNARFLDAVREQAVVLTGDVRLPETLLRASVDGAVALLACTDNDLANIQACLHARRLNPRIRTVARIFDDLLAERLVTAFQIDSAISPSKVATGAFLGAATDENALRVFRVGNLEFVAFRHTVTTSLAPHDLEAWRAQGLHLLAFRRKAGAAQPPSELVFALEPGDQATIAGLEASVRAILLAE